MPRPFLWRLQAAVNQGQLTIRLPKSSEEQSEIKKLCRSAGISYDQCRVKGYLTRSQAKRLLNRV